MGNSNYYYHHMVALVVFDILCSMHSTMSSFTIRSKGRCSDDPNGFRMVW